MAAKEYQAYAAALAILNAVRYNKYWSLENGPVPEALQPYIVGTKEVEFSVNVGDFTYHHECKSEADQCVTQRETRVFLNVPHIVAQKFEEETDRLCKIYNEASELERATKEAKDWPFRGQITDWRKTYGFVTLTDGRRAFLHRSDFHGCGWNLEVGYKIKISGLEKNSKGLKIIKATDLE